MQCRALLLDKGKLGWYLILYSSEGIHMLSVKGTLDWYLILYSSEGNTHVISQGDTRLVFNSI
jgi:hypothetical protein